MASEASAPPIVLVHGLWLTPRSWEGRKERFEARGHRVLAPAWPRMPGEVEDVRRDPTALNGLGLSEIVDHYDGIVRGLDRPPVIIGHSFGGLVTELLLDRALGAARVGISPAPVKGVLRLPPAQLRATFPVLANPVNRKRTVELAPKQFHYNFTNTMAPDEATAVYDRYQVPGPGRMLFQAAFANFNPRTANKVDFRTADRPPLLIIGNGEDHTVPASVSKEAAKRPGQVGGRGGLRGVRGTAPLRRRTRLGGGRRSRAGLGRPPHTRDRARMTWHPRLLGQQAGRTFVVTGANSGIGFEAARALVGRGAHVVLAVRDPARGEHAAARLAGLGSPSVVELDLSDLDQVAGGATTLLDRHDNLSALICNAGVMGGPLLLSTQGFERQMATNHLGHAALVAALWPLLHASAARVVLVSSTEARGGRLSPQTTGEQLLDPVPYDGRQVYRNTKQANLLLAQELHRRCAGAGSPVSAVAAHPGASATNLFARQFERTGRGLLAPVSKVVTTVLLQSAAAGARSTLRGSTTARRAAPSSAPPGSPTPAARRSCSTSTPSPRTRRPRRACGSSPSRCSAGRCRSDYGRHCAGRRGTDVKAREALREMRIDDRLAQAASRRISGGRPPHGGGRRADVGPGSKRTRPRWSPPKQ